AEVPGAGARQARHAGDCSGYRPRMGSSAVTGRPAQRFATRPRILGFCRPYLTADFAANLAPVADEFEIEFLTDGYSPGTRDTRAAFYANLRTRAVCPEL